MARDRDHDFDGERHLSEMAADPGVARVDGIGALHALPPDEEIMAREWDPERLEEEVEERVGRQEGRIRAECMNRLLAYVFEDGAYPLKVTRRCLNLAKAWNQSLLRDLGMESFDKVGALLGQTRAAVQAAFKRDVQDRVERSERRSGRNHGSFKAAFQKSASNVEKLRVAQRKSQAANGANRTKGRRSE